jgi:hypothetical protein
VLLNARTTLAHTKIQKYATPYIRNWPKTHWNTCPPTSERHTKIKSEEQDDIKTPRPQFFYQTSKATDLIEIQYALQRIESGDKRLDRAFDQ